MKTIDSKIEVKTINPIIETVIIKITKIIKTTAKTRIITIAITIILNSIVLKNGHYVNGRFCMT